MALDIFIGDEIPYEDLAGRLFDPEKQDFVPFLGAGASLAPLELTIPNDSAGSQQASKKFNDLLNPDIENDKGRLLVAFALILAQHLNDDTSDRQLVEDLEAAKYPPSANQLVRDFCRLVRYKSLSDVAAILKMRWADELETLDDAALTDILTHFADLTGIRRYTESLANITSYYEANAGRKRLCERLRKIFQHKRTPTRTHELVAKSAKFYLSQSEQSGRDDYIIMTTNYDCLMEYALDKEEVPYVALTVDRKGDVHTRYSQGLKRYQETYRPKKANLFCPKWPTLTIVYKIHGSLHSDDDPEKENVIISEDDYVRYIAEIGEGSGAVPSYVGDQLHDRSFLFLAYSLNDWNVRAVFERIRDQRGRDQANDPQGHPVDYSVLREVTTFEKVYCRNNNVRIVSTDLDSFVTNIYRARSAGKDT